MQSDISEKRLPCSNVIVFPFGRRVGRVDSLARRILYAQTEAQALKRLHVAVSRAEAELTANGFDPLTQAQQINQLVRAVKNRIGQLRSDEELSSSS